MIYKTKILEYSAVALLLITMTIGSASAAGYVYISPESISELSPGDTFSLSINVDSQGNYLTGISMLLKYDASAMEIKGLREEGVFGTKIIVEPGSGDDGQGKLRYGIVAGDAYSVDNSKFLTIDFRVKDDAGDGTYQLGLEEVVLLDESVKYESGTATGAVVQVGSVSSGYTELPETTDFGTSKTSDTVTSTTNTVSSTTGYEYEYIFGFHPGDYMVIGQRGTAPESPEEKNAEMMLLENNILDISENELLYPRGKIISLGMNSAGYLVVVFYEPLLEGSEIDAIYPVIETEAKDMGINDVPVEFGSGTGSQVSDALQELIDNVKAINEVSFKSLMDDTSPVYNSSVIQIRGTMPEIDNEKEAWGWFFQDSYTIARNSGNKLESYINDGIILSMGVSTNGYFEVRLNEGSDIDRDQVIDYIYNVMSTEARNIGIDEIPVVFKLTPPGDEDTFASLQDEDVIEVTSEAEIEAKETPGFGIIAGAASALVVCCMRRHLFRQR